MVSLQLYSVVFYYVMLQFFLVINSISFFELYGICLNKECTSKIIYLYAGTADTLGTELLESLLKMAPSKEEERKLKEYKDDSPTKLGPAEKFLKALLDVPFAFKRVEAMLYIVNFDSEMEYLRKSFQTLEVMSHITFLFISCFRIIHLFLMMSG